MKGTVRIDLTNVKTGEKKSVTHSNIVTNAVKDALTLNTLGWMYDKDGMSKNTESTYFPLSQNLMGGILLFENTLDADASKYLQFKKMVGCASNDANGTDSTFRGSRNVTESIATDDGYKFVYDFATSQANGTISSIALTSCWGGVAGLGNTVSTGTKMLRVRSDAKLNLISTAPCGRFVCATRYIDPETGYMVAIAPTANHELTVKVFRTNGTKFHIAAPAFPSDDNIVSSTVLTTTNFAYTADKVLYLGIVDGGDGYVYGFQHANNANGNSSGNATIYVIKISKADFTFTEETWTVGAQIRPLGRHCTSTTSNIEALVTCCLVHNGYMYCISYDSTKLYKINLALPSDTTTIDLPAAVLSAEEYGGSSVHSYGGATWLQCVGDTIFGSNFYLVGDTPYACSKSLEGLVYFSVPCITDGPYVIGIYDYWYNYYGTYQYYCGLNTDLYTPFLATINNLSEPILKTNMQTMKITYTLTEG